MYSKVEIRRCPSDELPCEEISFPKYLPRFLYIELHEDLNGLDTESALDVLSDRLYDLHLQRKTQRMIKTRRSMMNSFYTFICDLHDLCLDVDGFLTIK